MVNFLISLIVLGVGAGLIYLLLTDQISVSSSDNESRDIAQFAAAIAIFVVTMIIVFACTPIFGAFILVLTVGSYLYFTKR